MRDFSHWYPRFKGQLPISLATWLQARGSLTARLKGVSQQGFSVNIQRCNWQYPIVDEALALGTKHHAKVFCREVCLMDGDKPQVFARTIVPQGSYRQLQRRLQRIGRNSLGDWLFRTHGVARGRIMISKLPVNHRLCKQACMAADIRPQQLWARRSVFDFKGCQLLVSEVFLTNQFGKPT
ncbi:Chorismate--pyruvate lyase [Methylophaga frappieri]|uniref:Probable chorismate pyruvate-lyase n=1 Tax=Methylophaga frappieri (strain ATCC BAA-2434 / DSM 25690 / JAM7) TaxID=754477 RepID=I1YHS9_METFJ|nr:chorismate lyase [Methylophaga frappieri]AFJ02472.1 Chorismate--pyruvate lyase [Methylophaga frappieri]